MTSSECYGHFTAVLIIMKTGSDSESLPDLDELLASSFDPDISDKEVVGDRRMQTALG